MSEKKWAVVFQVFRQKGQTKPHFDSFTMDVDPEEYVLDVVERIWSFKDRSLVFRHACHHSTCGACGMRVNSVEKLTCITPVQAVTRNGGTVKVEPLRNFPVVSDLVVDMSVFYSRMEAAGNPQVVAVERLPLGKGIRPAVRQLGPKPGLKPGQDGRELLRLVDCIECGMCISACPVALTDYAYLGPAVLAGIQSQGRLDSNSLNLADSQDGVWRCHSVYECSAVCPSFVEPAWRIMDLRRQTLARRIRAFFYPQKEVGVMNRIRVSRPPLTNILRWFDPRSRQVGTFAFIMNRLTGLGLTFYLFLHLLALGQLASGPQAYDGFIALVKNPVFLVGEYLVVVGGILHGLNGLRIAITSLGVGVPNQKQLFYALMLLALAACLYFATRMFRGA